MCGGRVERLAVGADGVAPAVRGAEVRGVVVRDERPGLGFDVVE